MSLPGSSPIGARVVVWERHGFSFPHPCDLLVDAGILIARFDMADQWYVEVRHLWKRHIERSPGSPIPGLWVNSYIVGEYVNRSLKKALDAGHVDTSPLRQAITDRIREAYVNGAIDMLEGPEDVFAGLDLFDGGLGTADAFHAAVMRGWAINLITVDLNLAAALYSDPAFAGHTVYVPASPRGVICT